MARRRSLGKRVALGCGGLIVLLVVLALAGWGILRVMGGRRAQTALERLKASGAPTTWEEVVPPPVPDDENAAVLYRQAFALLPLPQTSRNALWYYLTAANRDERKAREKEIGEILRENADALGLTEQATKRRRCRFDLAWSYLVLTRAPNPLWSSFRELSQLTCAQALLRADDGDLPGALRSWSVSIAMVTHLGSDPTLSGQFIRYTMVTDATKSLCQILRDGRPGAERCRRAAEALARLEIEEPFVSALEVERVGGLYHLAHVRRGGQLDVRPGPGAGSPPGSRIGAIRLGYRFIAVADEAAMLQLWENQIALARKPYRLTTDRLDRAARQIPRYAVVTRHRYHQLADDIGSRDTPFRTVAADRDGAMAQVGLMRTGLGLAAYRTQFGRYPESLDQLRAALKWEVPEDPFSGKDFIYRREGSGYLLYSLGEDLDDDAGRPVQPGSTDGDIVWRVER